MSDVREAFRSQAQACAGLGSPFMGRLMMLCADRLGPGGAVADRVLGWPGDPGPNGGSVPLRLAGALHALIQDGSDPALAAVYPPGQASDDRLWAEVSRVLVEHETRLLAWLASPPQTNEVRRSAALIAAAAWIAARYPLPFVLSELGASAGLNLSFDRFACDAGGVSLGFDASTVRLMPEWRGAAPPAPHPIRVTERGGVDLNPLDPADPAARVRLLAYLWPDQPDRRRMTEAALALAEARPDRGNAGEWLGLRLAGPRPGRIHLVYNTIAWQYFSPDVQAACRQALDDAGRRASPDAPLAHVAMEADAVAGSAALTVELWPSPDGWSGPRALGRVDFHGRWIEWHD
jgi:hypothetical protein